MIRYLLIVELCKRISIRPFMAVAVSGLCIFTFVSTAVNAAGLREITVPKDPRGPAIHAMVWSPCAAPLGSITIVPPLVIPGVRDCPVKGTHLPLIVISHGLGGDYYSHHDTAETLADGGFVVVALNHVLDSGGDMRRANDPEALVERPADMKRLLDYMLRSSSFRANIDPKRIGFFGFSRGGYTGLVLASGTARFPLFTRALLKISNWWNREDIPAVVRNPDQRLKAFVIADPLSFFPDKSSLEKITAPIQLWSSEEGGQGVTPKAVAAIEANLAVKPEFHLVPNSTHLSFLFPCSAAVAKLAGDLCIDPVGFDRAAFHQKFNAQVLAFFRKSLKIQ